MAIIKSFAPFQNLSNFQVFLNDELANSFYFKITEFNETLTGGKNGFLIEGSEYLKESTEIKIEYLMLREILYTLSQVMVYLNIMKVIQN